MVALSLVGCAHRSTSKPGTAVSRRFSRRAHARRRAPARRRRSAWAVRRRTSGRRPPQWSSRSHSRRNVQESQTDLEILDRDEALEREAYESKRGRLSCRLDFGRYFRATARPASLPRAGRAPRGVGKARWSTRASPEKRGPTSRSRTMGTTCVGGVTTVRRHRPRPTGNQAESRLLVPQGQGRDRAHVRRRLLQKTGR